MIVVLVVQAVPASVLASTIQTSTASTAAAEVTAENAITGECAALRDEYTKVYRREDGSYSAVVSAAPLHFKQNGTWKDIDNTLVEATVDGESVLKNKSNDFSVQMPESLSDKGESVRVTKDGHTLSFQIEDVETSLFRSHINAQVETAPADSKMSDAQQAADLEKKSSAVTYPSVQSGVDYEYSVLPDAVKENIVLTGRPQPGATYSFTLSAPGMTAKMQADNSIAFYATGEEAVFTLPAPFMVDDINTYSDDIQVSFEKNEDGTYTLTYLPSDSWLQAKERAYPVVIDPAVLLGGDYAIDDTFVSDASGKQSTNYGNLTYATAGKKSDGSYWAYFKPHVALWASKAIVTDAVLNVYAVSETSQPMTLAASIVTSSWFETTTYSNRPSNETVFADCAIVPVSEAAQISFDITQALPKNQDHLNGAVYPYGLVLSSYDTSTNSAQIYTSEYSNAQYTPVIEYSYVETTGLSDRYEYHTQDAGRAGIVSVNDFTGGMYIARDELGIGGNIMPVSICQYLSTATADLYMNGNALYFYLFFEDYGRVWLTNYHRFVGFLNNYYMDENGDPIDLYFYMDGTGAITYFEQTTTVTDGLEKWTQPYERTGAGAGLTMWVPEDISGDDADLEGIIVEETSGEKMTFEECGRMVTITAAPDENITGTLPTVQVAYKDSNYPYYAIDKITDGAGREYRFTYTTLGNLTSMQAYDAQSNAITVGSSPVNLQMTYTYDSYGRLTAATYPDSESVTYSYVSEPGESPLLGDVTDIDGYRYSYAYNSQNQVTQITESALNTSNNRVTGNVISIAYNSPCRRTFTDSYGNVEEATFDLYGRKSGTYTDGRYINNTYEDTVIEGETFNLPAGSAVIENQERNLLTNPGFENGSTGWTLNSEAAVDSTVSCTGTASHRFTCATRHNCYSSQTLSNVTPGKYTFSMYLKVPSQLAAQDKGAKIRMVTKDANDTVVEMADSSFIKYSDGNWQRLSVSLNATTQTPTIRIYIFLYYSITTVYFDDAKVEFNDYETPYNALSNSYFENVTNNLPNNWTGTNLASGDIVTTATKDSATVNAMKIIGSPTTAKSISQAVSVPADKGDTVDIGCWAMAPARSAVNGGDALFRMRIVYGTSPQVTETVDFVPYYEYWQYAAASFTVQADCTSVTVYLDYANQINTAYFTDVQIAFTHNAVEEEEAEYCVCGENCFYGDGCPCTCTNEETCDCPQCVDARCVCGDNCAYGDGCDCVCASEEACDCLKCKQTTTHNYDSLGNVTSTTTTDFDKEMVTSNTYTTDKNYPASATDAAGNTATYNYNTANGTLTSVTDSLDNDVDYTYNAMRVLAGVSQAVSNLSTGAALTTSYTYTDDRLTGITAGNTVDYSFEYDLWGCQTEVSVGTQSLAEYTYGTGENRGRAESVTFGNGQTITYDFDEYNNVTGISFDGGTTYSYTYTYSGTNGLTSVTDNINGQITYFTGSGYEIYTIPQTGQGDLLYSSSYDEDDNFVQTANGYVYTYADCETETQQQKDDEAAATRTTGQTFQHSTISSEGASLVLSSSTDLFGRPVTGTVGVKDGENNLGSVAVDYTYQDGTGDTTTPLVSSFENIVTPTTGSAVNVEYTYTYDANGNILTDSLGGTLKHSYVYDEAGQLVRVNDAVQNKTYCYIYDNGGNMTSKVRYAYTTDTLGTPELTIGLAYGDSNWEDLLTSYSNSPLTYDDIGNLISFDGLDYTWTAGRQLAGIDDDMMEVYIDYRYNAEGLRTQKVVDDQGNFNFVTYDYLWADGKLVSQTDGTDVLYFLYDGNGSPIGFTLNDSATYLYIKNLQGDITGIADENGAVIVSYTYDAWGKLISITGSATYIGLLNPLRYRGYYYDTETQMYYLQSRYYHPVLGRFINMDTTDVLELSVDQVLGTNLSTYCENNIVNRYDPTGYWGADVHYGSKYEDKNGQTHDGTYEWAKDVWFNDDGARIIADADRKTDKVWHIYTSWLTAQRYHFNMSNVGEEDSRVIIAFNRYDTAVHIWKEAIKAYNKDTNLIKLQKQKKKALEELGIGLHALQDQQAHGDFKPSFPKLNHKRDVLHGPGYDDIYYDWRNWSEKTILDSTRSDTPGKRYYMTALISTLYLYSFRVDVGSAVPKK